MTEQPMVDSDENVLLWNGDIFEAEFLGGDASSKDILSKNVSANGVLSKDILLNEEASDTETLSKMLQTLHDDEIPQVRYF
jgi:asparagine synthetase B (glutamine-hydrolysing)